IADFERPAPEFILAANPGVALVALVEGEFLIPASAGSGEHEFAARSNADFRIAQVNFCQRDVTPGLPVRGVGGEDDADGAIFGDMAFAFAEGAEPLVLVADKVGKGIV